MKRLAISSIVLCLVLAIGCLAPVYGADDCEQQLARLEETNRDLHQQLRQAKRQLALLESRADEPGWPEVAGGLGVIFGLFGIVALVKTKRPNT